MSEERARTIVLALGNDIMGDDAVGLETARVLETLFGCEVDVVATTEAGLTLLEHLEGYEQALILDAIITGQYPAGAIMEIDPHDFGAAVAPSPHFTGLPEVLEMARRFDIPFPSDIRVLAMEIAPDPPVSEGLGPDVLAALPDFIYSAGSVLEGWGHLSWSVDSWGMVPAAGSVAELELSKA